MFHRDKVDFISLRNSINSARFDGVRARPPSRLESWAFGILILVIANQSEWKVTREIFTRHFACARQISPLRISPRVYVTKGVSMGQLTCSLNTVKAKALEIRLFRDRVNYAREIDRGRGHFEGNIVFWRVEMGFCELLIIHLGILLHEILLYDFFIRFI